MCVGKISWQCSQVCFTIFERYRSIVVHIDEELLEKKSTNYNTRVVLYKIYSVCNVVQSFIIFYCKSPLNFKPSLSWRSKFINMNELIRIFMYVDSGQFVKINKDKSANADCSRTKSSMTTRA